MTYSNILKTVGNTPVVKLNTFSTKHSVELYAKCEFMNPGGSIKDRIGQWMIEDAEKKGLLKPGGTIIESTSGNTGVGLAIAAAVKGYQCIFTLPDKMSQEKISNLRSFGAKVIVTPTAVEPDDPQSYYSVAKRLEEETPNSFYTNQYNNLSNRECHYQTTGPEVFKQMPDIDVFIAGIGTGGTICGTGKYLKEKKPSVETVAVDPIGSIVYNYFKTGKMTEAKPYVTEGIGEDFIPDNYDLSLINDIIQVEDKEVHQMTRKILKQEGIYAGVSSGAALCGALKWVDLQGERLKGKKVLIVFPDSGNRYLSKVYNDDWMKDAGFLDTHSLGDVKDLINFLKVKKSQLFMVSENETVNKVIELMKEKDISQIPVINSDNKVTGIINEANLLKALFENQSTGSDSIKECVDTAVEYVNPSDSLEKASHILTQGKTPLVLENNEIFALITKIDLISYLGRKNGNTK